MPITVDRVLHQRQHRVSRGARRRFLAVSTIGHILVSILFVVLPGLLDEKPKPLEAIAVIVVPPQALGTIDPPPPPPPTKKPPEPQRETPPPPPPPEPKRETPPPKDDRPVLPDTKPAKKPEPTPPPPTPAPPPPPAPEPERDVAPPPPTTPPTASPFARRKGSPTGDPIGASTRSATLGVEDPNFTYGYYLDRVVALISENWVRPQTGATDALLHFRIERDGTISSVELRRSSGDAAFDRAARRAVESTSPLPPLPRGYQKDHLGINLIVK